MKNILVSLVIFSALISLTSAQDKDKTLIDEFKENFNKKYFSVGVLLQVVGDFQPKRSFSGYNGFNIGNARLKVYGEFDKGMGYYLQTNFINSPAILDAKLYYNISSALIIDAGLFKAPFSREYLTSAADIDFVNRSQVVSVLAPNRQIGVQAGGNLNKNFSYLLGVFNGNRFNGNGNDNNDFLYSARLFFKQNISNDINKIIEIGINAAQSTDKSVSFLGTNFSGKRFLAGGDLKITLNGFAFSSEAIYGNINPNNQKKFNPFGYYISSSYMICSSQQILLRFDSFRVRKEFDFSNMVLIGYNIFPTEITEFQINYIIPSNKSINNYQLLLNAQINF